MLNNLTNFFNLIVDRRIKTQLENDDLIAIGTKQSPALGDYLIIQQKFEGQNLQYLKKGSEDFPMMRDGMSI